MPRFKLRHLAALWVVLALALFAAGAIISVIASNMD